MKKSEKWLMISLTVALLVIIVAGVARADSSSTATTQPPAPPSFQSQQELYKFFLSNLATTLGIDETALTADLKTASTETVTQAVYNGQLTQTQADQILSSLDKDGASFFRIDLGHGPGDPNSVAGCVYSDGRQGFGAGGGFMLLKPLADALSMDSKDVISDLQSGKTLSDLATAKGQTVDQIQSAVISSVKSQLDKEVSDGKMTSDQESQVYSKIEQSVSSGDWITQLQKIGPPADHHQPPADQQPDQ